MSQTSDLQAPVLLPAGMAEDLAAASLTLARHLRAGATLWCVSPRWSHHARHVAVEFVHPVVVGKPALPAVALVGRDPVAELRSNVRRDDVILLVASSTGGDGEVARDVARRAAAWGTHVLWFGAGPRPTAGVADHVVWVADDVGTVAHDGRFILLYHLLWELTHVCLEHSGLGPVRDADCTDEVCITCSDEAVAAEVVRTLDPDTATVRTADGSQDVDVSLVGPVVEGDLVLVHAGTAISRVEPDHG